MKHIILWAAMLPLFVYSFISCKRRVQLQADGPVASLEISDGWLEVKVQASAALTDMTVVPANPVPMARNSYMRATPLG